jgi:hypothetical protein
MSQKQEVCMWQCMPWWDQLLISQSSWGQFDSVDCQVVRVFVDTHNVKYWLIDTLQASYLGGFAFDLAKF